MAVREFNGTTDYVRQDVGGLATATYGTFGAIFKMAVATGTTRTLMSFLTSGELFAWHPFQFLGHNVATWFGDAASSTPAAITQDVWITMIARKASGAATPRFSYHNHTSATWTHANGDATSGDGPAPTGGFISVATNGTNGEAFFGRLAVTAGWANAVHWTADAAGDAAIEAAGLELLLSNWANESPDMLTPWNPLVADGIVDTIGTAHQVAISGTTQIEGDDPPGFSFVDPGPEATPPNIFLSRNLQNR